MAVEQMKQRFLPSSRPDPSPSDLNPTSATVNLPLERPAAQVSFDSASSESPRPVPRSDRNVTGEGQDKEDGKGVKAFSSSHDRASRFDLGAKSLSRNTPQVPTRPDEILGRGVSTESSGCAVCARPLFGPRGGSKYITVPGDGEGENPKTYHAECFRCVVCGGVFREGGEGRAIFVKANGGPCHTDVSRACRSLTSIDLDPSAPPLNELQSGSPVVLLPLIR